MNKKKIVLTLLSALVTLTACNVNQSNTNLNADNNELQSLASSSEMGRVTEIKLKNPSEDLIELGNNMGLDLFGYNQSKKTIRARLDANQEKLLKEKNFSTRNLVEKNFFGIRSLPRGYMTYKDMTKKLNDITEANPDVAKLSVIGKTHNNNSIYNITITGNKSDSKKVQSLFLGGMHARELAPVEIMMKMVDLLANGYGKDKQITDLLDTRIVNIVPMVNVDGRIKVQNGSKWQRKNARGVDLNRNFDSFWNYEGLDVPDSWKRTLKDKNGQSYSGPSAASEPETKAVQNFIKAQKSKGLNMVLDMHAYGDMFLWPLGYTRTPSKHNHIFKNMHNNSFGKIGYRGNSPAVLLYPTTGTTIDYPYVKHQILGFGMEVGSDFRPSYSEVERMWEKLKPNMLYMIKVSNTSVK